MDEVVRGTVEVTLKGTIKDPFGFITDMGYDDNNDGRLDSVDHSMLGQAGFTYNVDDQLSRLTLGNGAYTDYTYDSYGRLTAFDNRRAGSDSAPKESPGLVGTPVLGSWTGPNVTADHGNRVRYFQYNDLGTVLAQTDANGDWEGVWEPDFWGNYRYAYSSSPSRPELGLTGKMWDDDAGLYYFNARWFDAERGRWLSKDPLNFDGPNDYHFIFNNVVNSMDPSGKTTVSNNNYEGKCQEAARRIKQIIPGDMFLIRICENACVNGGGKVLPGAFMSQCVNIGRKDCRCAMAMASLNNCLVKSGAKFASPIKAARALAKCLAKARKEFPSCF